MAFEGNNLVGVDIGSSSIKVCQLKSADKGFKLLSAAVEPLPPQTIVDGNVMNSAAIVDALRKIFTEQKIQQKNVALSVSGHSVIIKKITVPLMTPDELEEQFQWEAEQHIPFDINDVQVDHQILRKRPDQGLMDILLVAARKEEVDDYS